MTLSNNVKALTVKYVEAGHGVNELAHLFGANVSAIRSRLRTLGIKATDHRGRLKQEQVDALAERNKSICQMYVDGHTLQEVGDKYGVTRERIRQILVKNGVTERFTSIRDIKALRQQECERVMQLYLQGLSRREAAWELGLNYKALFGHLPRVKSAQFKVHKVARFWRYVKKETDPHPVLGTPCWIWTGGKNPVSGYGRFSINGKSEGAHRTAYEFSKGKPKNWVLHWCDHPACVNPDHLYDGTPKENARDRDRIRPSASRTRLSEQDLVMIRERLANGESSAEIAQEFDRCGSSIYSIERGRTYTGPPTNRITEEIVRRVWAYKGNATIQQTSETTGVSVGSIWNIWNGKRGNDITGLPPWQRSKESKARQIAFNSECLTVPQWAKRLNITSAALRQRLKRFPIDQCMVDGPKPRYFFSTKALKSIPIG